MANVSQNLISRLKLIRRISASADNWAVKEGAPTVPEEAADLLEKIETAQRAAATGDILEGAAACGAAPETAAGISVSFVNILVIAGLLSIFALGVYLGHQVPNPAATDGKTEIITADQADKERQREEALKAAQGMIKEPYDVDPEKLQTAKNFLQSVPPEQKKAAGIGPVQKDNRPEFSVHGSDQTVVGAQRANCSFDGEWELTYTDGDQRRVSIVRDALGLLYSIKGDTMRTRLQARGDTLIGEYPQDLSRQKSDTGASVPSIVASQVTGKVKYYVTLTLSAACEIQLVEEQDELRWEMQKDANGASFPTGKYRIFPKALKSTGVLRRTTEK
jgi:hypothetical protein